MKAMKKMLCIVLAVMMLLPVIPVVSAEAAAKTAAPAYNGKWTYYAVYNTIYKLNSETGTAKKVTAVKDASFVSDISYYDGYLYFTANYYAGTDATDYYVCRMKANGTAFTKLGRGYRPAIYDKKIYYLQTKHVNAEYGSYDDVKGIAVMSLTGKNSKLLVKNSETNSMRWNMKVAAGKVYYAKYLASSEKYAAMAYDMKTGKTQKLFTKTSDIDVVNADGAYVYYSYSVDGSDGDIIGVYNISSGKLSEKTYTGGVAVLGGKNGTVYFSGYDARTVYSYDAVKNKVSTVIKNKYLSSMTWSKSGYHVFQYSMTQEEFEKSGYQYDVAMVCMKLDGTGYKVLKKFYVP